MRRKRTKAEYIHKEQKKSAVLFAAAMKMGATLSGANNDVARALWDFGRMTG
ncbi:MAG: polyprenyl synthetase family protein, partial [Proteobacteria bacterium]|nr:polyprenyl synthetase family protein [Pseudomonadota bacterium]